MSASHALHGSFQLPTRRMSDHSAFGPTVIQIILDHTFRTIHVALTLPTHFALLTMVLPVTKLFNQLRLAIHGLHLRLATKSLLLRLAISPQHRLATLITHASLSSSSSSTSTVALFRHTNLPHPIGSSLATTVRSLLLALLSLSSLELVGRFVLLPPRHVASPRKPFRTSVSMVTMAPQLRLHRMALLTTSRTVGSAGITIRIQAVTSIWHL